MAAPDLQETFQNLVEEHKKILYKVCNSYCRDCDSRDDLAREIMIQLWRSFGKFDGRCRFSTWMYRVASTSRFFLSQREHQNAACDFRLTASAVQIAVLVQVEYDERLVQRAKSFDELIKKPNVLRLAFRFIDRFSTIQDWPHLSALPGA